MEFQVYRLERVDSTNLWLKRAAAAGQVTLGAVVQADYQTGGRGRLGRKWEARSGEGLLFSLLLKPLMPESHLSLMGLVMSLALVDGIEKVIGNAGKIDLRWPNDLLFEGKKLGGILCESAISASEEKLIVVGVGININQSAGDFPEDLRTPAISLFQITGRKESPAGLLPALLDVIDIYLERVGSEGWRWIAKEWLKRSGLTGIPVEVADGSRRVAGVVAGILDDGALILSNGESGRVVVRSGELVK